MPLKLYKIILVILSTTHSKTQKEHLRKFTAKTGNIHINKVAAVNHRRAPMIYCTNNLLSMNKWFLLLKHVHK